MFPWFYWSCRTHWSRFGPIIISLSSPAEAACIQAAQTDLSLQMGCKDSATGPEEIRRRTGHSNPAGDEAGKINICLMLDYSCLGTVWTHKRQTTKAWHRGVQILFQCSSSGTAVETLQCRDSGFPAGWFNLQGLCAPVTVKEERPNYFSWTSPVLY